MNTLADELLPDGEGQLMFDIITEDNQGIESCFTKFFKQWSEREIDATWQKLIDALKVTKKYTLAKELTEALIPPVTVTGGPQQAADQQQPSQQPLAVGSSESLDQQNRPQPQTQMQDNNHPGGGDEGI